MTGAATTARSASASTSSSAADLVDGAALERDGGGGLVRVVAVDPIDPGALGREADRRAHQAGADHREAHQRGPHQLGHVEDEVERLAGVQARVAERRVGVVELLLGEAVAPAEALGDVVAGDLEVDAARPRALGVVDGEEALDLGEDVAEVAASCGRPRCGRCSRASGRRPRRPGGGRRARRARAAAASRRPARRPSARSASGGPGCASGSAPRRARARPAASRSARASRRPGCARRRGTETCAPSAWRVRSPTQRKWAEQSYQSPVRESLRVSASSKSSRSASWLVQMSVWWSDGFLMSTPIARHELERPLDLRRELLVAAPLGRVRDELLRPRVHLPEICKSALREGPQQVERGRRLVVALQHPPGIGRARLGRRLLAVDDVAAEDRELDAVHRLRRLRARLHELAGDPAELHHGQAGRVGRAPPTSAG